MISLTSSIKEEYNKPNYPESLETGSQLFATNKAAFPLGSKYLLYKTLVKMLSGRYTWINCFRCSTACSIWKYPQAEIFFTINSLNQEQLPKQSLALMLTHLKEQHKSAQSPWNTKEKRKGCFLMHRFLFLLVFQGLNYQKMWGFGRTMSYKPRLIYIKSHAEIYTLELCANFCPIFIQNMK